MVRNTNQSHTQETTAKKVKLRRRRAERLKDQKLERLKRQRREINQKIGTEIKVVTPDKLLTRFLVIFS